MTSTARRGAVDVARIGALLIVVLGHLSLAVVDRGADGAIRGSNLLALHPALAWLAMLAPMPVFFAAAGWANAFAGPRSAARRLRTLVGLGAVVVVVWSTASVLELLLRDEGGIVADGARIATQPLWFLAAYLPFTVTGSWLANLARSPVVSIGLCLAALTALDVARFAFHAPNVVGWPGFYLAWGVPCLLGCWWRHRWEHGNLHEWRAGAGLAAAAGVAAIVLVMFAGYSPALIDAVPGARSNTTPPTLFTAVAAMAQVGVLLMVAGALDRVAVRRHRLVERAGEAAVGVYVWHLTALALCAAAIAAGLWTPARFTAAWWLTRPLWFAAVLGVTTLLVASTAGARQRLARHGQTTASAVATGAALWVGYGLGTLGAAVVGIFGPRTLTGAVVAMVAFPAGWWLLRPRSPATTLVAHGERPAEQVEPARGTHRRRRQLPVT